MVSTSFWNATLHTFGRFGFVAALSLISAACGPFKEKSDDTLGSDADTQGVSLGKSFLFDANKPLVACWSSSHPSQAALRKSVETHVTANFNRTQRLRIQSGWKNCDSLKGQFDISVFFYDDPTFQSSAATKSVRESFKKNRSASPGNPRVIGGLGKRLRGKPFAVVLNSSDLGRPDAKERLSKLSRQAMLNYTISSALHEFGHAVGLLHEHAHPKSQCALFDEDLNGGIPLTAYDSQSIMNYCKFAMNKTQYSAELNHKVFGFSNGDIYTLNKAYSR
ncbi:MAG: Astacin [Pseudomonadota bacterium]